MTSPSARPFGLWTATALVMGGMIGSGVFLLPASLAPYGWTGVAAWVVTIAGTLLLGYVIVRLVAARPLATGVIGITGEVLGPLLGTLNGWAYWLSVLCSNAAIATAAVSYLSVFLPGLSATPLRGAASASALIWALTLLNLGGARLAGRVQVVTTILKIVPLVAVIVILVALGVSGRGHFAATPTPEDTAPGALTTAVALCFFAMLGFESASLAAERVQRPEINVFRATIFGTAAAGLFYLLVCSGIVLALPLDVVRDSPAPFATFIETFWGHGPALAVAAFAAIAAIGALNGWVLIQGEVPLGMAREGFLPAWFGRVDQRDVPVGVLILSTVLATALVMSNAAKSLAGIFEFMILLTTATSMWLYVAACVAAMRLRLVLPVATAGLAFSLWVMWGVGIEASGLSLLLLLTGLPFYWLRSGRAAAEQPA